MYTIFDYPKENIPPPSVAIAHTLDEAGAANLDSWSRCLPFRSEMNGSCELSQRALKRLN